MRVLVPVDGSDHSERALDHAIDLYGSGEIVLLNVLDLVEAGYDSSAGGELPGFWGDWHERAEEDAAALFAELADGRDVTFDTDVVVGRPARSIVEYAEENDVDAVVMGSHGRDGVSRILLGSVAETVVRRSPVPVTVVR